MGTMLRAGVACDHRYVQVTWPSQLDTIPSGPAVLLSAVASMPEGSTITDGQAVPGAPVSRTARPGNPEPSALRRSGRSGETLREDSWRHSSRSPARPVHAALRCGDPA